MLNPFSVYEKGEPLLRKQLGALSAWHLVNIVLAYELSDWKRRRVESPARARRSSRSSSRACARNGTPP